MGTLKINIDGSFFDNLRWVGIGGLVQNGTPGKMDHRLVRFSRHSTTNMHAAIRQGMKIADDLGDVYMEIYFDLLEAMNLIMSGDSSTRVWCYY